MALNEVRAIEMIIHHEAMCVRVGTTATLNLPLGLLSIALANAKKKRTARQSGALLYDVDHRTIRIVRRGAWKREKT
jgi:hypothetical protein